ncbi:MAG: nicotinate phosphoribosyltransferase [Gammaproteobacteria bacterium]|nr:nicotinate phosphoribosyltransferase [Gammaproteobacteria bacterium]MBU6508917.1 nicotinate phosphoribosyltransferase [Gammaproteobacteria bacterium]MDE1983347.1 nicotinate phosphoribosyltransferase [Gammaproteobacteria bacterium]MDE2108099.1 nicotinate phosphoribosyltransferase [Gammaproteobacteria bacterium]MDE2461523.1 nicotinate phosphoribosyltransferase [Gammaproteobacteria bacterium]
MIIESLLDTDLYKFTMMQAVLHHFPAAQVEYRFHCRTEAAALVNNVEHIRAEVAGLCSLRFTREELDYLRGLRYLKKDFVDILHIFQLQQEFVSIAALGSELEIVIRGPWLHTILFEVPLLAILSELHAESRRNAASLREGEARLDAKIARLRARPEYRAFRFSEFGTRRRFSRDWQRMVVQRLAEAVPGNLAGTSNVLLAKQLGLTPIGTMGHEFLQACQALGPRLADSQRFALQTWAQEYRGDLGIALSDVIGIDAFLRDFDLYFCKLFDGVRQDSGDPFAWGEKLLTHYHQMRVDPLGKTLVFTDALDMEKALRIFEQFHGRIRVGFGIGTHLSNDLGFAPPDMIIKMTRCNGQAVAKISDDPAKTLCLDKDYLAYLKKVFAA